MRNRLLLSQIMFSVVGTVVFPYYLLILKNVGNAYGLFALLYALFSFSSALTTLCLPTLTNKINIEILSSISFIGMGIGFCVIPNINSLYLLFLLQTWNGVFQGLYKLAEKELIKQENKSWQKSSYSLFFIQLFTTICILSAGFLAETFTIHILFYIAGVLYFICGLIFVKNRNKTYFKRGKTTTS